MLTLRVLTSRHYTSSRKRTLQDDSATHPSRHQSSSFRPRSQRRRFLRLFTQDHVRDPRILQHPRLPRCLAAACPWVPPHRQPLNEQLLKFPHFTFQATFRSSSLRTTFYSPQATPRHLASLAASTFSVRQSATERLSGRGTQRSLLRKRNETVQPLVASPHVCTEASGQRARRPSHF